VDTRTAKLPDGKYWEYMDAINPYAIAKKPKIECQGVLCVKHKKRLYRCDNGLPLEQLTMDE